MKRIPTILFLLAAPALAQPAATPAPPARPKFTLESIAPSHHGLIRQRARHFFRMPDGTIWDGWNYAEYRRIIERSIKPFERVEPGAALPGQTLVESRPLGTVWKIKQSPDSDAWALEANLADTDGLVGGPPGSQRDRATPRGLETVDPHTFRDIPSLWSSRQGPDFTWPFAFIDEADPDPYTKQRHDGYLEVTRIWGDGRYEFRGHSLDSGELDGIVTVPDPVRYLKKDRFKGTFFLWPEGSEEVGGQSLRAWRLIPADDLRMTPDALAEALMTGQAELAVWDFERTRGKIIWKRTLREISEAPIPAPKPPPPPPRAPTWSDSAPDLVVLNDGRWFRGRVTKSDDTEVIILTRIGEMEAPMTFKRSEVKDVQTPERR